MMGMAAITFLLLIVLLCCISAAKRRKRSNKKPQQWSEHYQPADFVPPSFRWTEVVPVEPTHLSTRANCLVNQSNSVNASTKTNGIPVYISLTTMMSRIGTVDKTIISLLSGRLIPDHIFLFISSEPFILDTGVPVKKLPVTLLELSFYFPFTIVYTDNIGPHRKLLPLLAKKWHEDCIIATFDDENQRGINTYLEQGIKYYAASGGTAVVSLRARKMGFW